MKELMEKGLLFLLLALVVTVATLIFAVIVITGIATLLGNLAIWPIIGAYLIGVPITFPMALAIAALMAIIIYGVARYYPVQGDRFFEVFGALFVMGVWSAVILAILGLPGFFVLALVFDIHPSGWAIFPIGLATAALLKPFVWKSSPTP
jgi:hypothetical protein